jgi:hypothetical protein
MGIARGDGADQLNPALTQLNGLHNLQSVTGHVTVSNNPQLFRLRA